MGWEVRGKQAEKNIHAKKPLVEGSGKEGVQQVLVDQGQAQDTPTEAKPRHNTENIGEYRNQNWIESSPQIIFHIGWSSFTLSDDDSNVTD